MASGARAQPPATTAEPLIVFAHGAGAGSSSEWMTRWAEHLGALGRVVPFDYPYIARGSGRPDSLPALVEAHGTALDAACRDVTSGNPSAPLPTIVLAGKSMGSRVGCHLSLQRRVHALICFGFPLVSAGKQKKSREAVLLELETPVLFIQGTRDPLCPLPTLEDVRRRMRVDSALHVVEGGDHSLAVTATMRRSLGLTSDAIDRAILDAVRSFLKEHRATPIP